MKTTKRLITTILTPSILLSFLAGITVSAFELNEDLIIEDSSPEEELMPMAAAGCSNYDYENYTMNQLKVENGWTLRMDREVDHYKIYSGGDCIGLYHTGRNNGQQPHFHLNTTSGVHYILCGL